MRVKFVLVLFLVLLLLPIMSASNADSEIQKLTHYAEEYETGNINYAQLLIYVASSREKLNEVLGATGKEFGGIVKQNEIRKILGEPVDKTKWVWVEGEEHDAKLDEYVPVWKKIVFDGKKIRIGLEAFPSIFKKKKIYEEYKDYNEEYEIEEKIKNFEEEYGEELLIYRLHFNVEFKKPQEQLDIESKINEIESLAKKFNEDPSDSNAEELAKKSVTAERLFENYFRQGQGKCEDLMKSIFGSENKREAQKILLSEITFFEGDNFEAVMRLEMCDDCEWNWINMDMHIEGRGPGFRMPKEEGMESKQSFKNLEDSEYKSKTLETVSEMKSSLEQGDYSSAMSASHELRMLTEAWNEKSNDVWEDVEDEYTLNVKSMTEEERFEFDQNYGWIKQEQEKRKKVKSLQESNYESRKEFYLSLFSEYDKQEYYFTQTEFEKRLVEEFKEFGKEICNNNKDDNENEKTDCEDEQCGGKVCGEGTTTVQDTNGTKEVEVDFYCIQGICQAREEIVTEPVESICGNHVCEEGESTENCAEDCSSCSRHPPIECSGRVIFKGKDKNGCPLNPICIEETGICETSADCPQPLCGVADCVEGKCVMSELSQCQEAQCPEGQEKVKRCGSGEEIIAEVCFEGIWKSTGTDCGGESSEETAEEVIEEEIVSEECSVKEDCGGEDDVCSNGKCVTIPGVVHIEEKSESEEPKTTPEEPEISESEEQESESEEPGEEEEPEAPSGESTEEEQSEIEEPEEPEPEESSNEEQEESSEEAPATGEAIFSFFRSLFTKGIVGIVTAQEETNEETEETIVDESEQETTTETEEPKEPEEEPKTPTQCPDPGEPPQTEDNCWHEKEYDENGCVTGYRVECGDGEETFSGGDGEGGEDYPKDDWEEEHKKHEEEQKQRCNEECSRSCTEKCIREACGESMDCDVDEESKKCESECPPSNDCVDKCMSGEEGWWEEFEEEHKEEKGVFQVGGGCRTSQGRTEGFIWFGGWGDPFEQIQDLKHKYYSGGEADWCKYEVENLVKQRQEFERSFNEDFAKWFFEKHLANSAEDWEQSVSGIFELYWNSVDNQMQMMHMMHCLETNTIEEVMDYNLIDIEYDTEYGRLKYWEEIKEVKMPGMRERVTVISPYMKVWIFPPKSFIKYELKQAMEDHEFPGSPEEKIERKNEGGLTEEEKEHIREDRRFMNEVTKMAEKYGGSVDVAIQFKEEEEVVFNLYVQINEQDVIDIEPMTVSELPEIDITVTIPFSELYDIIHFMEKEMKGEETESPPWDRRPRRQIIKGFVDGIKMGFKIRSLMGSAEISPESASGDAKSLFKHFFKMKQKSERGMEEGMDMEDDKGEEKEIWESKEVLTGEVILE